MEFKEISLSKLLSDNAEKKLVLPNFQRNFVWDISKQKTLLASFILGLPIGNLLILEGKATHFSAKDLCLSDIITPSNDCLYLLDGQQRLSTLKNMLSNLYDLEDNWKSIFDKLPNSLKYRWFIEVGNEEDTIDFLGYRTLHFEKEKILSLEPSQITDSLISYKMLVKDVDYWFHPHFEIDNSKERRIKIIEQSAESNLIPLFEVVGNKGKELGPLHERIINKIAKDRADKLLLRSENDEDQIINLLEHVDPSIKEILRENNKEELHRLWTALYTKWTKEVSDFINDLQDHRLAYIRLPENEFSRAFAIFETINQGGTPLDEYDIIVAKAARDRHLEPLTNRIVDAFSHDINILSSLTHWNKIRDKKLSTSNLGLVDVDQPTKTLKNYILNLLSIFTYTKYSQPQEIQLDHIKRKKILGLEKDDINNNVDDVTDAIRRAVAFLVLRCGLTKLSDLPYKLMLLPIAYALKDHKNWKESKQIDKIEFWYWSSIFSGHYRDNQNSKAKDDIRHLYNWLKGGKGFENRLDNIFNAQKYSDFDMLSLNPLIQENEAVPSAIQKALLQYTLSRHPQDFFDNQSQLSAIAIANEHEVSYKEGVETLKIQDHHIFPIGSATDLNQSSKDIRKDTKHKLNSPLNRTYISSISNRLISSKSPENYLKYVDEKSIYGHSIPFPLTKWKEQSNEGKKEYYDRLLRERFELLKRDMKDELLKLQG